MVTTTANSTDNTPIIGFKWGGSAGAILHGGEVKEGDTSQVITDARDTMVALAQAAEKKNKNSFSVRPVMSLAGNVNDTRLELTASMVENFRRAGITNVGDTEVKAGNSISLEDFFNDYLTAKNLPNVQFVNPVVGNDGEMVMRAAVSKDIVPPEQSAGLLISSTGSNIAIKGGHNFEAGHASANTVTKAATGEEYPHFFAVLDGLVRLGQPDPNPAYLEKDKPTFSANTLEPIISGGEKDSAMKLSDFENYSTSRFRGVQVDAVAAISALIEGGTESNTVLTGLGITENNIRKSPLLNLATTSGIRNEDVTEQALSGDEFALSLTKYAAVRMAQAMVGIAKLSRDKPPKNVILQGSYIKHVLKSPEALEVFKTTYENLTGIKANVQFFNPEYDGVGDVMKALAAKK